MVLLILLPTVLPASLVMMNISSPRPKTLGLNNGRLAACPKKPNCVSTQSDDSRHAVDPIRFDGPADVALTHLRRVLREQPRVVIVTDDSGYIHAEARSRIFRFVDDLEFFVDEAESLIHFRSASRVGHSDLGVNRERAESIRSAFERCRSEQSSSLKR